MVGRRLRVILLHCLDLRNVWLVSKRRVRGTMGASLEEVGYGEDQPCQPAFRRPSSMCSWSSGRNQGTRIRARAS